MRWSRCVLALTRFGCCSSREAICAASTCMMQKLHVFRMCEEALPSLFFRGRSQGAPSVPKA